MHKYKVELNKMKILIANKFYYYRGGDCTVSISMEKLFKDKGHDVAFFSMKYPLNLPSQWEEYFPTQVNFDTTNLKKKLDAIKRLFCSNEVKNKFTKLLDDFKPDIVHLNNIHSQLSPIIGEIAHKKGIKVVWTLHDYKLICPTYSCIRNGNICERCVQNSTFNVFSHKCMKNSLPASLLAYLEAVVWDKKRLIANTDFFIAPSHFMKQMMIKGGFPDSKIGVLSNFTNREYPQLSFVKENYYCYIGRLSKEKGLKTLIEAASNLPYKLIVVGSGPLKDELPHNIKNIQLVGFKNWEEISSIVAHAKFTVIPSEWYENNPLSIIESLCLGTPVLGANIGGIPEAICSPECGMLFKLGNVADLKEKIKMMFNTKFEYQKISLLSMNKFSQDNFYNEIIKIYE